MLAEIGAVLPELDCSRSGVVISAADAMMEAAAKQLGDAVGVEVAAKIPLGALGPVDYVLSTSATVREGLTRLSRFYGIATERVGLVVTEEPIAGFELRRRSDAVQSRYWIEFSLALILGRLREGVGSQMTVDEVTFAHDSVGSSVVYERFFGAPVKFGAAKDLLAIPRALLDAPLRTGAPLLAQMLNGKLSEIETSTVGDTLLRRVCNVVSDSLEDPELDIDVIARSLAMSRRSLQRHLSGLGTSYSTLVDDIRRQRAQRLIEQEQLTPAEMARRLGFADASAFFRAFRRWTGETPGRSKMRAT
ncbi:MAG: AraC family transcriptional regulator ligand-binding domain-containing protein [Polyangiaceae bacterium]